MPTPPNSLLSCRPLTLVVVLVVSAGAIAGLLAPGSASAAATFTGPTSFTAGANPAAVVLADVNGDAKFDTVTANSGSADGTNGVSVLPNTTTADFGPVTFSAAVGFGAGANPAALTVGDVNGDFRPDIVVANGGSATGTNGVSVLLNTGGFGSSAPSFSGPAHFDAGAGPASVAVGDLNKDGRGDVVVANQGSATGTNGVSVLLSTTAAGASTATFTGPTHFNAGANPASVAVGEINRDFDGLGNIRPDVVVANSGSNDGTNGISILLNTTADGAGTPSFGGPTNFSAGANPTSIALADYTNDLPYKIDIATANSGSATGTNGVSVLLNTNTADGAATPSFSGPTHFDVGANPAAVFAAANADFAGVQPDIVTANQGSATGTNGVSLLGNTMGAGATTPTFTGPTHLDVGANPASVGVDDLTGDGPGEIVTAGTGGVSVLTHFLASDGRTTPACTSSPGGTQGTWSLTRHQTHTPRDPPHPQAHSTRVLARGPGGEVVFDQTTPNPAGSPPVSDLFASAQAALAQVYGGGATYSGPTLESSSVTSGPAVPVGTFLNHYLASSATTEVSFGPATILVGMDQSITMFIESNCINTNTNVHTEKFVDDVSLTTDTNHATYSFGATLPPGPAAPAPGPAPAPAPDPLAATRPSCVSIPGVVRDKVVPIRGGGQATLATRQVDDPANPLRAAVRVTGVRASASPIRSVAYRINRRAVATAAGNTARIPAVALRPGRARNRLDATVTLRDGRRVTITQYFIVTRCPVPTVTCRRQPDPRTLRCSSRTPLGVRRVSVRLTGTTGQTAAGSAPVTRGRYTTTLRSRSAIAPGRYAYRHTGTTRRRGEKVQMVRLITIT